MKYSICRDLKHSMQPHDGGKLKGRNAGYWRVVRCSRCGVCRKETLSSSGEILKRQYFDWPEGYIMRGQGRLTAEDRAKMRVQNLKEMWNG